MTANPITTEELQKLLDAATPGPWPSEPTGDGKRIIIGDGLVDGPGGYEVAEVYSDDCDRNEADANAALIRMSRDLAAELITARAKIAAAEKLVEVLSSFHPSCNEASFYKDCAIQFLEPHSLYVRINISSDKAFIVADLEARRTAALAAWEATQ